MNTAVVVALGLGLALVCMAEGGHLSVKNNDGFPCICQRIWDPVCGAKNGLLYANRCEANCLGINGVKPCDTGKPDVDNFCICPFIYDPVCTAYGKQYDNACIAECVEAKAYSECPPELW